VLVSLLLLGITIESGCQMSTPLSTPAPPRAAAPIVEFSAAPNIIEPGEPVNLQWKAQGATTAWIDPWIGGVSALPGMRRIFPMQTTTYRLMATGPAGSASASVLVNVAVPAIDAQALPKPLVERLAREVQDAYFDFGQSQPRDDACPILEEDANALTALLQDFPDVLIIVEGHCDDVGSVEYNLELGYRRAEVVKGLLEHLGVPASRLKAVTRGEMSPICAETSEACRAKNRRVHFAARRGR
jgi:outer membrane protein OmpA-like peptidoglycan-associated protein